MSQMNRTQQKNASHNPISNKGIQSNVNVEDRNQEITFSGDRMQGQSTPSENIGMEMKKRGNRMLLWAVILFFVYAFFFSSTSVTESDEAKEAMQNHMSKSLEIGTVLLRDDNGVEAKDYTIKHSSEEAKSKIHIWDYAGEDGDYVQILVDGTPLGGAFMILNKPATYTIPSTGEIQIKGIRDGGGGITYAVNYELNGTTYYNGMDKGEGNTYTLMKD